MNTADQKFVVVRKSDNTRISGRVYENKDEAEKEIKSLCESVHQPMDSYDVKQVLNG